MLDQYTPAARAAAAMAAGSKRSRCTADACSGLKYSSGMKYLAMHWRRLSRASQGVWLPLAHSAVNLETKPLPAPPAPWGY